mmetsp:Transcript_29832/g.91561  ORF Transcript_29832/g.91561 Transcript_29832/m.91561 type:complete len:146 (-) Transcript_29832:626-1063(-)
MIDVCRQATYGYDQRAEALGTKAMVMTDNMYPNTARTFTKDFVGMADLPYDFFMSRYVAAYEAETLAFIDSIEAGSKADAPITGEDGVVALAMAIAAGKSAEERRWVKMSEVLPSITTKVPPRDRLGSFLRSLGSLRRDVAPQKA